jgi:hypothetical protein
MRVSTLALTALVVVACSIPTDVCGCPPTLPWMVRVAGTVTSASATTASKTAIGATAVRGACPALATVPETRLQVSGPGVDSIGRIRNWLAGAGPDTMCIRAVARRTVAGRIDSVLSPRATAVFRQDDPLDSLHFDFRFP